MKRVVKTKLHATSNSRERYRYYPCEARTEPKSWNHRWSDWRKRQHFVDTYNWIHQDDQDISFRAYWHAIEPVPPPKKIVKSTHLLSRITTRIV